MSFYNIVVLVCAACICMIWIIDAVKPGKFKSISENIGVAAFWPSIIMFAMICFSDYVRHPVWLLSLSILVWCFRNSERCIIMDADESPSGNIKWFSLFVFVVVSGFFLIPVNGAGNNVTVNYSIFTGNPVSATKGFSVVGPFQTYNPYSASADEKELVILNSDGVKTKDNYAIVMNVRYTYELSEEGILLLADKYRSSEAMAMFFNDSMIQALSDVFFEYNLKGEDSIMELSQKKIEEKVIARLNDIAKSRLLLHGVDASSVEDVFGVAELTLYNIRRAFFRR